MENKKGILILNPKEMEKERKQQLKRLNKVFPFPTIKDTDKDGVPDILDCDPFNPKKQGILHFHAPRSPKPTIIPKPPRKSSSGSGVGGSSRVGGGSGGTSKLERKPAPILTPQIPPLQKITPSKIKSKFETATSEQLGTPTSEQLETGESIVSSYSPPPTTLDLSKEEEEDKKWYEKVGGWITGATPQKWFKENIDPWITEHLKNPLHERFSFITEYKTKIENWFENLSSQDPLNKASDSVKREKLKELSEKGQINYKGQTYRISSDGKIERVTSPPFPSWLSGTTFGLEPSKKYQTGKEFSVRYAHMWAGRKTAEKIPETWKEKVPSWLNVGAEFVSPMVAEAPTFSFFSPFMETGATGKDVKTKGKTKGKTKQISKVKTKGKSGEKLIRKFENLWKKEGQKGVLNELYKYSYEISKRTGVEKQIGISNMEKILTELSRKGLIKNFIFDTNTGQFTIIKLSGGSYNLKPIYSYKGVTGQFGGGVPPFSMGRGKIGVTGSLVSGLKTTQETETAQREKTKLVFGTFGALGTATATRLGTGTATAQKTKTLQKPVFGTLSALSSGYSSGKTKPIKFGGLVFPTFRRGGVTGRRKIKKPKLRTQKRAYQPSVGAVSLGISISPQQAKKLPKTFSGLMLRPMIRTPKRKKVRRRVKSYPTSINQMFKLAYPRKQTFGVLYPKKRTKKVKRTKKRKIRKSKIKRKYVRR